MPNGPNSKPQAYDPWSGEWLCPCPGSSNTKYYSRETGQVYCVDCPSGAPSVDKVWNPYDNQGYCICK